MSDIYIYIYIYILIRVYYTLLKKPLKIFRVVQKKEIIKKVMKDIWSDEGC